MGEGGSVVVAVRRGRGCAIGLGFEGGRRRAAEPAVEELGLVGATTSVGGEWSRCSEAALAAGDGSGPTVEKEL